MNSSYEVNEKFRNFLLGQEAKYAEASQPAEEFRKERVDEERQIRDALNQQERKDNITLSTGFEDINTKRRKQRIDSQIRSVLSRLIDDMNDSKQIETMASIDQLKDIVLSNDGSTDLMTDVNDALLNLLERVDSSFKDLKVRKKVRQKLKDTRTISRMKEEKPEDFKRRLRLIKMDDVDALDFKGLDQLAVFLGIDPTKKSDLMLKDEIKNSIAKEVTDGAIINWKTYEHRLNDLSQGLMKTMEEQLTETEFKKYVGSTLFNNRNGNKKQEYKDFFKTIMVDRLAREAVAAKIPDPTFTDDELVSLIDNKLMSDTSLHPAISDSINDSLNTMNRSELIKIWKYYQVPEDDIMQEVAPFTDGRLTKRLQDDLETRGTELWHMLNFVKQSLKDAGEAKDRQKIFKDLFGLEPGEANSIYTSILGLQNVGSIDRDMAKRISQLYSYLSDEDDEDDEDDTIPGAAAAASSAAASSPLAAEDLDDIFSGDSDVDIVDEAAAAAASAASAPRGIRRGPPATPARPRAAAAAEDDEDKGSGIASIIPQVKDHLNMLYKMKKITKPKLSNAIKLIDLAIKKGKIDHIVSALQKMGL